MFDASVPGTWKCPEEIPAIISKLGFWPDGHNAQRIRDAQQAFCDNESRSECVNMNDMSRFYHYDPISFLIGGHRMANAYLRLNSTRMNFTCPQHEVPTTRRPTSKPTRARLAFRPTSKPTSHKPTTGMPSTRLPSTTETRELTFDDSMASMLQVLSFSYLRVN